MIAFNNALFHLTLLCGRSPLDCLTVCWKLESVAQEEAKTTMEPGQAANYCEREAASSSNLKMSEFGF